MNDPVFIAMLELCMSMGNLSAHRTFNEEEALCYNQLCRTISAFTKAQQLAVEGTLDEIIHDDDEPEAGAMVPNGH